MVLIELHSGSGKLWINPEYISSFTSAGSGSAVFIANDHTPALVKEKPEDILQLIKSAFYY